MADWRQTDKLTEVERLVVEYADVLSSTPVTMSADLTARLREQFSERQVVDLANNIAWENYRARFNRGLGVESDGYANPRGIDG